MRNQAQDEGPERERAWLVDRPARRVVRRTLVFERLVRPSCRGRSSSIPILQIVLPSRSTFKAAAATGWRPVDQGLDVVEVEDQVECRGAASSVSRRHTSRPQIFVGADTVALVVGQLLGFLRHRLTGNPWSAWPNLIAAPSWFQ